MYQQRPWFDEAATDAEADRQTASLAGVVVILVLLVAGLFLVQHLQAKSAIEDCLLAGRMNCDAVMTALP